VLAAISIALSRFGVGQPRWDPRELAGWVLVHGLNVVVIVAGATIVIRAANLAIEHLLYKLGHRHENADLERQRRAMTLGGILTNLVTASVAFVAVLMLLRELSIDVLPILTGAGIAGLAIGFGAQNLVRDVISGFFLILRIRYASAICRSTASRARSSKSSCGRSCCATARAPFRCFPTARLPRSPI
jgi:small-conductance mechanosensitive channel